MIGVMPLWDDKRESLWMLPGYLDGIMEAGGLPVIFPFQINDAEIRQLCDSCDGFLFTGGHDICPELYGEKPLEGLVSVCKMRDELEKQVFDYALTNNKAVLGICRGMQFINAMLGGTLYQDIPLQHPSDMQHRMSAPYDRASHTVSVVKDSELYRLLRTDVLGVNSRHHQAIKSVAPNLKVMAEAEDGIVEAVCAEDKKYIWAVQWHPELSYKKDENSKKIFKAFVEHC